MSVRRHKWAAHARHVKETNLLSEEQLRTQVDTFRTQGYVVLERLISPEQVQALKTAMLAAEETRGYSYAKTSFEGYKTVRINNRSEEHTSELQSREN